VPNDIPLSLYVHIPWCVKKCPYCDFNSHEKNAAFDEENYLKALLLDLETDQQLSGQRTLNSIFFGGGTPSLFSAETIGQVIEHARTLFGFNDIEITLEANPGTFEQQKFTAFREAGVNRLSIGIQSFNENHLRNLGRIHDSQQAFNAVTTAKQAGFDNINLDLMFGLPQQSIAQASDDIKIACESEVQHISHYQLTIEENTYFHKHKPLLPESDLIWDMQTRCQEVLADNDYQQYEISAYAKAGANPNRQSKHNLNYWQFGDYIGIGAGAHGKLTTKDNTAESENNIRITRRWKHRQPQQYIRQMMKGDAVSGQQQLATSDTVFEFLLNALRLKAGCEITTFEQRTGLDYDALTAQLKNIDPSLLNINKDRIGTTDKGFLFLNEILERLV
jgi:putative oxygen-independent coproporphyrinogen III oxidase